MLLGNALAFLILFSASYLPEIAGDTGAALVRLLMQPGVLLIIGQLCVMLIPFLVYLAVTKQKVSDVLPLRAVSPLNLFLITLITLTLMPLAMFLGGVTALFFDNSVAEFVGDMAQVNLGFTFVVLAIVPSIFEEISLRGIVLSNYRYVDIHKAALVNGFFFGLIHLNPSQFLYAFLLGYVFALMVFYTKSIFSAIYAHFVFNGTQLLQFYWAQQFLQNQMAQGEVLPDVTSQEMLITSLITFAIIAAIFTPVAIILFKSFKGINRTNLLKEELEARIIESGNANDQSGLAISTCGSVGYDAADYDSPRVEFPETSPSYEGYHGEQPIVTIGFVFSIIIYILYVLFVIL